MRLKESQLWDKFTQESSRLQSGAYIAFCIIYQAILAVTMKDFELRYQFVCNVKKINE